MIEILIWITILSLSVLGYEIWRSSRIVTKLEKTIAKGELERPDLITLSKTKK